MVKRYLLILTVLLFVAACHTDKSSDPAKELVILNNSLSNELDSVVLELSELDTGYFSKYLYDLDIKKCKILVKISTANRDTLVDFFVYDTSYRDEMKVVSINGVLTSPEGIVVQISDEEEIARGILYETKRKKQRLSIDLSHSLHHQMTFRDGRLEKILPPLADNDNILPDKIE